MRKFTKRLLTDAEVAERWGFARGAEALRTKAASFESRQAVVRTGDGPLFHAPLKSLDGAKVVAGNLKDTVEAKLSRTHRQHDRIEIGTIDGDDTEAVLLADGEWYDALDRPVYLLQQAGVPIALALRECYVQCDECFTWVRSEPDSYGWLRKYAVFDDGEVLCQKCVREHAMQEYLTWLNGDTDRADTLLSDEELEDLGYVQFNGEFETGLHLGQDDDPRVVAKWLWKRGIETFLFRIASVGQFDVNWQVWVKTEDATAPEPPSTGGWAHGRSPSKAAIAAMKGSRK